MQCSRKMLKIKLTKRGSKRNNNKKKWHLYGNVFNPKQIKRQDIYNDPNHDV